MANVRVEYAGGFVEAELVSKGIKLTINDDNLKTTLVLDDDLALEVADSILALEGLPTTDEVEEEKYKLLNQLESLKEAFQQYEENLDAYKDKLKGSCEPF